MALSVPFNVPLDQADSDQFYLEFCLVSNPLFIQSLRERFGRELFKSILLDLPNSTLRYRRALLEGYSTNDKNLKIYYFPLNCHCCFGDIGLQASHEKHFYVCAKDVDEAEKIFCRFTGLKFNNLLGRMDASCGWTHGFFHKLDRYETSVLLVNGCFPVLRESVIAVPEAQSNISSLGEEQRNIILTPSGELFSFNQIVESWDDSWDDMLDD